MSFIIPKTPLEALLHPGIPIPKAPKVPPAPQSPVNNQYAQAQAEEEQRLRNSRGASATLATGPQGDTSTAPSASSYLLGGPG